MLTYDDISNCQNHLVSVHMTGVVDRKTNTLSEIRYATLMEIMKRHVLANVQVCVYMCVSDR